jgi:hypothetical protein
MFYDAVFCITGGTETLKYIVRNAINSFLPKEIVWRENKLGFEAPQKT